MAVLKRLFHGPEQGSGEESRYYLARDTESGQVFVLHELSLRQAGMVRRNSEHIELSAFLLRKDAACERLLELFGTLVGD